MNKSEDKLTKWGNSLFIKTAETTHHFPLMGAHVILAMVLAIHPSSK